MEDRSTELIQSVFLPQPTDFENGLNLFTRHAVSKKKGLSITEKHVLVHYHDATLSTDLQLFLPCPLKSAKRLDCVPRAAQGNQCEPFLSTVNKAT